MKKRILLTIFLIIFNAFSLTAREKLNLKIGTYENAPKIFTDENGNVSGFWSDVTNYIANEEGLDIEWIHGNWNQCLQRLENNEIDVMVDVAFTPNRMKRFAFQKETTLLSWSRIYVQEGSNLQSILDLEGKKVAGLKGSVNIDGPGGLKNLIKQFHINCEIIELESYRDVFELLQNGEVFAGITNKNFGTLLETEYKVKRTPIIIQPASLQFAFSPNSPLTPKLIKAFDENIIQPKYLK